jgi:predicted ATPase
MGRNGERHPLEPVVSEFRRHFGGIQVDLRQTADRQFVDAFLDSEPNRLGATFRDALYQHARGHALFTVEALRGMQERGDLVQDEGGRWIEGPALDWETLPARVEGAIGERINRLPATLQEVLKAASVEGEFFTAEVLARAKAVNAPAMVQRLSGELDRQHRLVKSQSSRRVGPGGGRLSQYRFRHILFQRYLYTGLDDVERAYLHETVGTALEELYQGQTEEVAVQLAWHFQMAGSVAKSAGYLGQAGERAVRLSAHEEAIAHFTKALELLKTLPDPAGYAREELSLQTALGHALIVAKGSAAPEVERALARARELCQHAGETPQLFQVLWGLHTYYLVRGKIHPTALELAGQLLDLAQSLGDPALIIAARYALGSTLFWTGDHAQAQAHLEPGIKLHDLHETASLIPLYGQDPGVMCRRYAAWTKWFLGFPDQAMEVIRETIALAQELDHPFTIAGAEAIALNIELHRREEGAVKERAEELIALSTEHGFLLWKITAITYRGWTLVGRGRQEEGLEQIRQGVDAFNATGAYGGDTVHRSLLVEAHLRMGQVAEGLEVLEKTLTKIEETGERYMEAEYYRLKGELLLLDGADEDEVEGQFFKAIDIARQQSARSLELRATVSLCRLWGTQKKKEEARHMLVEIYSWFTEGFDTPDLKEARELLDAIEKRP